MITMSAAVQDYAASELLQVLEAESDSGLKFYL